jgi:hypothetical protein
VPFDTLKFTITEVESALFDLDDGKGPRDDGVPPFVLKNYACAYAVPLLMIFNRSLATSLFLIRGNFHL